ncbi:MAG: EAL domain-containing protein [Acidobacteria bacterium]|nr:EAL domain-containing protein [Acidobacteriota bacterium]
MNRIDEHPQFGHHLSEAIADGIVIVDETGVIRHVNRRLANLTGYSREEMIDQDIDVLIPGRFRDPHVAHLSTYVAHSKSRKMGSSGNFTLQCRDGSEIDVDIALSPFEIDDKKWVTATIRDGRSQRVRERSHDDVEQRFRLAFESNMAPMMFHDHENRVIAVNDAFCLMIGRTRDELVGLDSTAYTHPEDLGITEATHDRLTSGEVSQARYVKRYLHKDGRVVVVEVFKAPARDAVGNTLYYVLSQRDITEERALTEQLSHQALHDPLTGLANRALFDDRLSQALARAARFGDLGAVLLLDLDDFKGVNDTYGHVVGDQLLRSVVQRLEEITRTSDTLCRFGGDEFLYLAEALDSPDQAHQLAQRVLRTFAQPFAVAGTFLQLGVSIGIVLWDGPGTSTTEVIQNADIALYEAKRQGKSRSVFFTANMQLNAMSRFALTQQLRHALHSGDLEMHYQPIMDLRTSEVVGFEALMRWQHAERGWVPPSVFIALAEENELILEIGLFALRESIEALTRWDTKSAHAHRPFVTVNLSLRQFHDSELVPTIANALSTSGLEPSRLILEITESVTLLEIGETLNVIERLKALGIAIALDDFGTGYSSLSYLTLLQPKIIKIDQSFVSPAHESVHNHTLLEAIVSLGRNLNMIVIAEGIETESQLERLRQMGCDLGQGHLFSRAMRIDDLKELVDENRGHWAGSNYQLRLTD